MQKPIINYDGVEREMTDEEWEIHQEYQAETRRNHASIVDDDPVGF
jgi:hypothetical protein